jgi:hypothetical protein
LPDLDVCVVPEAGVGFDKFALVSDEGWQKFEATVGFAKAVYEMSGGNDRPRLCVGVIVVGVSAVRYS